MPTERHNHKDFVVGTMGNHEVVLQQCGIGKVNSAIGAVEMIDHYHPDLVISTGCAGGADTDLNPLDVVVASECVYHVLIVATMRASDRSLACHRASRLMLH